MDAHENSYKIILYHQLRDVIEVLKQANSEMALLIDHQQNTYIWDEDSTILKLIYDQNELVVRSLDSINQRRSKEIKKIVEVNRGSNS